MLAGIHFPSVVQSRAIATPLKALGIKIMWTNTGQGYCHKHNRLLMETDNPDNDFVFCYFKKLFIKIWCLLLQILYHYPLLSKSSCIPSVKSTVFHMFCSSWYSAWWAVYANNIYWGLGNLFCFCQDCCSLHCMILPLVLSTCSVAAREQFRLSILMACD